MTYATFKDIGDALVVAGTETTSARLRINNTILIFAFQNITALWMAESVLK